MLKDLINKKAESYIDDMFIEQTSHLNHLKDLQDLFDRLPQYQMWFNSAKFAFGF